jgi:hypothetical protein
MDLEDVVCQFCGKPIRSVWRDVIIFECGSRSHHVKPFTEDCWRGFVWKLQERIEALEKFNHYHSGAPHDPQSPH